MFHPICKKWMVICIIRIVLGCIVFCNDRIYSQIKKKPQITLFKVLTQYLLQIIFFYNFTQHKACSYTQTTAPGCPIFCLWKFTILHNNAVLAISTVHPPQETRYAHSYSYDPAYPESSILNPHLWYILLY